MKSQLRYLSAALILSATAIACGGSKPEAATPAAEPEAAPAAAPTEGAPAETAAPATWAEAKTKEQKGAFMKAHVAPRMGAVFKAYDAEEHAQFGCATCHGEPFKDHPPEFLPKLTFSKDGKLVGMDDEAEEAKFMAEKVLPEMIAILGVAPFDAKTGQGFGCNGCHTVEMK